MTHKEITQAYLNEETSGYGFWDYALVAMGLIIVGALLLCECLAALLSFTAFHIPID